MKKEDGAAIVTIGIDVTVYSTMQKKRKKWFRRKPSRTPTFTIEETAKTVYK